MNIDGGDGFDTLIVIGTEVGDVFVITSTGVFGAGRVLNYVNIEQLDVDGMEGDDRFFVHSTAPGVVTADLRRPRQRHASRSAARSRRSARPSPAVAA